MKQASGCSDRSSGGFDEAWEVYQSKITSLSQLRHKAVTSAVHVLSGDSRRSIHALSNKPLDAIRVLAR